MPATPRFPTLIGRLLDLALVALVGVCLLSVVVGRVVPLTGRSTFVVGGGSMEPAVGRGAAVVVEPVDALAIAVGDIVTLQSGGAQAVFTHRVIRLAERNGTIWIETRGDANAAPDPSLTPATAVIGRVTATLPLIGYAIALLSSPAGVLFAVSLGLLILVAGWVLDPPPAAPRPVPDRRPVPDTA